MKPLFSGLLLSLILSIPCASTVLAQSKVVVRPFYGPHAEPARREVVRILSKQREVRLVSNDRAETAARRLGTDLTSRAGRVKVAAQLRISAWIEGLVQNVDGDYRLTVLTYDGKGNERVARHILTRRHARQLPAGLRSGFWHKNGDALLSAEPPRPASGATDEAGATNDLEVAEAAADESPAEAEPPPTPTSAPVASASPAASAGTPSMALGAEPAIAPARWSVSAAGAAPPADRPDVLWLTGSLGTTTRKLAFRDAQTQSLGDYSLPIAAALALEARYYPGAHFSSGFASWLGLDVQAGVGYAAPSEAPDGTKYDASLLNLSVGGRLRIPLGTHELSVLGAYAIDRFAFSDSESEPAPTPDTDYRAIKLGLEGIYRPESKWAFGGRGAFSILTTTGELGEQDYFPRLSGNGIEIGAFGSYALRDHLDLTFDLSLDRYFFDFHSKPGDATVAGGAADTRFNTALGVRYTR